ncbi:hypothetical protein EVAR_58736_1 [Eumeta japonica]|uniref:Uncharacterized protein n=1 Tax=Eumeta variegata TaxID=151549 RepID=A0A4C1YSF2_EUMVA|nr:hypothetical protein EVAR_58736_1 [Eumeta japonica]
MASEGSRSGRRMRNGMTDNEITEALDDSDIDFSDTNSDDDPAYLPPELMPLRNCGSSSSDDDERSDDTLLEAQVPSPAISENSLNIPVFVASRGRTRDVHGRLIDAGVDVLCPWKYHYSFSIITFTIS